MVLRIPVIVITQSGMVIIQSWHRDQHREQADHSSERSDGDNSCREPPLREVTRHLISLVFVRKRERACGPLWAARAVRRPSRGGNRVFCDFHAGGTVHRLFRRSTTVHDAPGTTIGRRIDL